MTTSLVRRAESILDVAGAPGGSNGAAIVVDREGGMRMLNPDEWTLAGLISEFGAREVYHVRRRADVVTVEGWSPKESCKLTRNVARRLPAVNLYHLVAGHSPAVGLIE